MHFNNKITPKTKLILNSESCYLVSGKSFNNKIKNLAGDSSPTYNSANTTITTIKRTNTRPNVDGTIYYYSDIESPLLNPNCSYMFSNLRNLQTIEFDSLDFTKVTNMSHMFSNAGHDVSELSFDLSDWDTRNVTNMSSMFSSAGYNATTLNIRGLSNWNTSSVTNMSGMFSGAGGYSTNWSIGDLSNWNTSNVIDMSFMFESTGFKSTEWSVGDLSNWDTSKVTNMSYMFYSTGHNATTWNIGDLSNWNTSSVTNMSYMFGHTGYNTTTWSIGDLSNWNVSQVTNMSNLFNRAGYNAKTWNIGDLSIWDTSKVRDMSGMFCNAGYKATTWNSIGTLKVYASYIQNMFSSCSNGKANIKIYNNPTYYNDAFFYAATKSGSGITVDYTSSVTNIDNIIATKSTNSNVLKGNLIVD